MKVAEYFAKLKFDTKGAETSLKRMDRQVKNSGRNIDRFAKRVNDRINKIGTKLGTRVGAAGAGLISLNLGKNLINEASDLEEAINAADVVFGDFSGTILEFSKNARKSTGLARSEFLSLANLLQPQLKNAGLRGEELNQTLIKIFKRAADIGSTLNKSPFEILEKITSGLSGEGEPLKRIGILIDQATLQQEALAQGITKTVSKMTEQEKISLRIITILRQSDKFAGDYERTLSSVANAARDNAAASKDLSAVLGKNLLPAMKALQSIKSSIIDGLSGMSQRSQELLTVGGALALSIGAIVVIISTFVAAVSLVTLAIGGLVVGAAALIFIFRKELVVGLKFAKFRMKEFFDSIQENKMVKFIKFLAKIAFFLPKLIFRGAKKGFNALFGFGDEAKIQRGATRSGLDVVRGSLASGGAGVNSTSNAAQIVRNALGIRANEFANSNIIGPLPSGGQSSNNNVTINNDIKLTSPNPERAARQIPMVVQADLAAYGL